MRQTRRRFKRGWAALGIFAIGGIGCLAAGVNRPSAPSELSAAQIVALRFPEDDPAAAASAAVAAPAHDIAAGTVAAAPAFALFDPNPSIPSASAVLAAPALSAEPQAAVPPAARGLQLAAAEPAAVALQSPAITQAATAPLPPPPAAPPPAHAAATAAPAPAAHDAARAKPVVHHAANRPGFLFNDAQIASIKRRLNLTPDQERYWPAVEAALRNIAYAKAHARGTQTAAINPDSMEVQGLKSAAFPLIMSFSAEQKSEVRNLAHVMGLDQLASQF